MSYNVITSDKEGGLSLTKLKQIRQEKKLTQIQLAELSGAPRINITRYESGIVTPGGKNLIKLAEALECPAEELLKEVG